MAGKMMIALAGSLAGWPRWCLRLRESLERVKDEYLAPLSALVERRNSAAQKLHLKDVVPAVLGDLQH